MSANPFDPPSTHQHDLTTNPFESSSTQQNPFQHPNDSAFSLDSQDTERGLGGVGAKSVPAPATGFGFGGDGTGVTGTGSRNAELEERERRLRQRELEVEQRARDLGIRENNWPRFFPIIHHDISDLPADHRQVGGLLYFQWLALALTLVINLLGCIFLLVSGSSEGGADVAAAGGYLPIIGIASFVTWYRPIYLGLSRTEGKAMAFFFYIYFAFAGCHLLFSIYMAIGIPSTGSAGLINTIQMFAQAHILAGVFGVLSSIGWIIQAAGGGLLYKKIWDFKNGNAEITFAEATNQFKSNSIATVLLHQARI